MKKAKIITIVFIAFSIIALSVFVIAQTPLGETLAKKLSINRQNSDDNLEHQYTMVLMMFVRYPSEISSDISFRLGVNEQGKPYFIGVIDSNLEKNLDKLVKTYNEDPSVNAYISPEDVRYYLTEGIVGIALSEDWENPFFSFIQWTMQPADLIDTETGVKTNTGGYIKNYYFVLTPEFFINQEYSWRVNI